MLVSAIRNFQAWMMAVSGFIDLSLASAPFAAAEEKANEG
jgi:hypothetical protein